MVEGSPRRVTVAAHDSSIKIPLDLSDDDDKLRFQIHPKHENVTKSESEPSDGSPGESRWKKLRTTVQLGNAVVAHHRKPPLKREDSFLKRFSTRPPNIVLCDKDPAKADNWIYRVATATVLNPDESLLFWWLWLVTFCGLYNSWTLIVRQAFPELQDAHIVLWKALDWCSDLVYILDIAVQFRTGYLEQGIMVRDGAQLAKHYVMSRDFFLDVAVLLPLSYMPNLMGESPLLRFPRFLKARRIYKFYYAVESRTAYPNFWRVANLIHVLLLLAHWFGCFYYMLSELEGFKGSWAYKHPDYPEQEHSPLVRKYLGSVYWSTLTLTTIGDLATPATNLQYLFTIISYLIGVFIFATIVGQVGNVITNRNASRLEFERLLDGAKLYMRHHKVPKGMQRRVQRWYDYSWSRGRMQGGGDIHSALGILPDKLKTELAIHVNLKTLKKVSIFKECQPEFLHDLVLKMKAYIFTPGDLVCRKGEVAREMFIIADGILQVINDKGQVLTHMRAGDFFGEIGILNLDGFNRRTADVRSVGYSELFSLSREDVLSAMKDYPEAEAILQSMGRRRLMEARMSSPSDKSPYQDDSDAKKGKSETRQRKKGISLAYLLRKKETQYDVTNFHTQKYSNISLTSNRLVDEASNPDRETSKSQVNQNSLIHLNHVEMKPSKLDSKNTLDDNTTVNTKLSSCLVEQITSKFRKRNKVPHFRIRRKHTWWYRISNLVHLRKKTVTTASAKHSEICQSGEEVKLNKDSNMCDVLLKPENLGLQNNNRNLTGSQKDNSGRRTSWQLSKPSVSNWNRSELFTPANKLNGKHVKSRRKTLADGMLLSSNFNQDKPFSSHEKVPGILMTGSDLNSREISPDISPMSSNYSLTPSTSDEEENINGALEKAKQTSIYKIISAEDKTPSEPPELPVEVKEMIANIVMGIKEKVNSVIVQSEKNTILEILELREKIRQQDTLINYLEQRCSQEAIGEAKNVELAKEEMAPSSPVHKSSPSNKPSEDPDDCSMDIPSPVDLISDVKFEGEDMWLVEFPSNVNLAVSTAGGKRPKLRRHSSVEVGNELPFRLAIQKPQEHFLRPTVIREEPVSPRRFSESHARPDAVTLNKSFAAKVRRVLAKVKVNKEMEGEISFDSATNTVPTYKWPHKKEGKAGRRSSTGSTNDKTLAGFFHHQRSSTLSQSKKFQDNDSGEIVAARNTARQGSNERPVAKRILPTITESCSFDSLRESPLMTHVTSSPLVVNMESLENKNTIETSVSIDLTDEDELSMVELPRE